MSQEQSCVGRCYISAIYLIAREQDFIIENFKNTIVIKRLATMETWLELSAVSEGVRWGWEKRHCLM